MIALLLLLTFACLAAFSWLLPALRCVCRVRRAEEPPLVRGHLVFGVGAEFQRNAVRLLHETTARLGPVFTIRLLNKWVTIVQDPHLFQAFCRQKEFDFGPVQKQVNMNVFKFAIKNSQMIIRNASSSTRGDLTRNMQNFNRFLHDTLEATVIAPLEAAGSQEGTSGLNELLVHTQFVAIGSSDFLSNQPSADEIIASPEFHLQGTRSTCRRDLRQSGSERSVLRASCEDTDRRSAQLL